MPFLGWAFAASRHVAIDRRNRERGLQAIRHAAAAGRRGVSIILFPEGTRSVRGELLPFKKGGFHLAVDAGLPILPVAIRGTERVMPKRSWSVRPGRVDVRLLAPVQAPPDKSRLPQLLQEVRERIRVALENPVPRV